MPTLKGKGTPKNEKKKTKQETEKKRATQSYRGLEKNRASQNRDLDQNLKMVNKVDAQRQAGTKFLELGRKRKEVKWVRPRDRTKNEEWNKTVHKKKQKYLWAHLGRTSVKVKGGT